MELARGALAEGEQETKDEAKGEADDVQRFEEIGGAGQEKADADGKGEEGSDLEPGLDDDTPSGNPPPAELSPMSPGDSPKAPTEVGMVQHPSGALGAISTARDGEWPEGAPVVLGPPCGRDDRGAAWQARFSPTRATQSSTAEASRTEQQEKDFLLKLAHDLGGDAA